VGRQITIALVVAWVPWVVHVEEGRGHVVRSAPGGSLFLAHLCLQLGFVESLKRPIVSFIQSPSLIQWHPALVDFLGHDVVAVDGTLEHGRVSMVKLEALTLQHSSCLMSFEDAL
jgi:hypothetical protein